MDWSEFDKAFPYALSRIFLTGAIQVCPKILKQRYVAVGL